MALPALPYLVSPSLTRLPRAIAVGGVLGRAARAAQGAAAGASAAHHGRKPRRVCVPLPFCANCRQHAAAHASDARRRIARPQSSSWASSARRLLRCCRPMACCARRRLRYCWPSRVAPTLTRCRAPWMSCGIRRWRSGSPGCAHSSPRCLPRRRSAPRTRRSWRTHCTRCLRPRRETCRERKAHGARFVT